jgi:diguanylate cyclase (GGDEF)-like protein
MLPGLGPGAGRAVSARNLDEGAGRAKSPLSQGCPQRSGAAGTGRPGGRDRRAPVEEFRWHGLAGSLYSAVMVSEDAQEGATVLGSARDAAAPSDTGPDPIATGSAVARLKRALYLFLLPFLAGATLITGLLGAPGSFDRMVLPFVTVVLLGMALPVYGRWIPPRHIEQAVFGLFALLYLGKLGTSLVPSGNLDQIFVWTPLLYVLAFLLFEPRPALFTSLGVLVASGAVAAGRGHVAAVPPRNLFEFFLATALLIAMVYGLSRLRHDVASLRAQLVGMRRLANQDALTGLPNRRSLEATLTMALDLAERHAQDVAVLLFDLDDFKRVNDRSGHDSGDEVLRGVARRGEGVLRRPDSFGRWGGEEFLVIAPGIDLPGALRVAERLREALRHTPFGPMGTVTASFGVTTYHPGDTVDSLLKRADDALYLAKQAGKDRVEALAREMVQHVTLPVLARPFHVADRPSEGLQRGTLAWLRSFDVAAPDTLYRWVDAVQPGWLAAHMQRTCDPDLLQLVSDWSFWMFLHDDHCDASAAGRHPRYLIDLHQRLLEVLSGGMPEARDGALAALLADLWRRLASRADETALRRFADATDRYFAATRWEAANRASGSTPDLETYQRMRLLTSGLQIHTALLQAVEGLPVSDHPLAKGLYAAADHAVCWANDIYSLNKEVQEEDVHNLVVALQAARHLGLDAALTRAAAMHDEQVARFQQLRASVADQPPPEREVLERIAAALETRMAANVAWSERCSRYRAAVTVQVKRDLPGASAYSTT